VGKRRATEVPRSPRCVANCEAIPISANLRTASYVKPPQPQLVFGPFLTLRRRLMPLNGNNQVDASNLNENLIKKQTTSEEDSTPINQLWLHINSSVERLTLRRVGNKGLNKR
jgi:hypothetical protein